MQFLQLRLWLTFFFVFLPNLICVSEVTDDVHQCVSACPSFMFFSGLNIFTCCSLFFSLHSVSFIASNDFVFVYYCICIFLKDCFCLARANARLRLVFSVSLLFRLRFFTYLELLYLRYFFSYAVFISACFNLRYRSGLGLLL